MEATQNYNFLCFSHASQSEFTFYLGRGEEVEEERSEARERKCQGTKMTTAAKTTTNDTDLICSHCNRPCRSCKGLHSHLKSHQKKSKSSSDMMDYHNLTFQRSCSGFGSELGFWITKRHFPHSIPINGLCSKRNICLPWSAFGWLCRSVWHEVVINVWDSFVSGCSLHYYCRVSPQFRSPRKLEWIKCWPYSKVSFLKYQNGTLNRKNRKFWVLTWDISQCSDAMFT